jgi:hypothetical protein
MIVLWGLRRDGPLAAVAKALRKISADVEFLDQTRTAEFSLAKERRYIDWDLAGELGRLGRLRAQHVAELETLDNAAWTRTGRHGEHGEISIELYEAHVAAEEVDHLAQISRILAAPSG